MISLPLVSEVFNSQLTLKQPAQEWQFKTTCTECGWHQRLDEAEVDRSDPFEVRYVCGAGCGPLLLIVSAVGQASWKGRGHQVGDWVIRNPAELTFRQRGMVVALLIPANPAALD